ncbi:hypothetical protein EON81_07490 [bacterium]|nr:MAG: hypothetical protein EON81_07490 [bacterium]
MLKWAIGAGVVAAALVGLFPLFVPGGTHCGVGVPVKLSSAKQLATGMVIYQSDFDDRMAPTDWRPAILPYVKNPGLFENHGSEQSYIFAQRASLSGVDTAKILKPEGVAMLFDVAESSSPFVAELDAIAYRATSRDSERKATIAFLDTRVRSLLPTETKAIR